MVEEGAPDAQLGAATLAFLLALGAFGLEEIQGGDLLMFTFQVS
ncbi:MAG: hypothetical protein H6Q00_3068 [Holophagaceae bacterium]|nr:hypothetical protein [Holophagaceae bacterium]